MDDYDYGFRVAVLGTTGVGKSSLLANHKQIPEAGVVLYFGFFFFNQTMFCALCWLTFLSYKAFFSRVSACNFSSN